ncbi:hypothetical protein D6827_01200 [Candidatus Parcubacteria bacterium]|nr:MAG: hypothetical protein D6827_01200 [Candidatus Parcubacteria bacterium]
MAANAISLEGLPQLTRRLQQLEFKLRRKVYRSALRKATKPILSRAKQLVTVDTGTLRDSLKIRVTEQLFGYEAVVTPVKSKGKDPYYAHFVELGHVIRRKRGGKVLGHVEAKPFLRPAFDENYKRAISILAAEIRGALKRFGK